MGGAQRTLPPMAKQRQVRIEQRSALAAMQALETRSDEELLAETKYKAAAQAILGARAAEKYDAGRAREHFRKSIAVARPQERMQLRRMADASLALAERRPDDLKQAVERLGQAPPSNRQLLLLRIMGLIAPSPGSSPLMRARGFLLILLLVIVLMAIGFGVVKLIALPFGGVGTAGALLLGLLVIVIALGVLALIGRRRQAAAQAKARAG
jgi:ribosomal protein L12E/L44/L45/RPP1/RPP2